MKLRKYKAITLPNSRVGLKLAVCCNHCLEMFVGWGIECSRCVATYHILCYLKHLFGTCNRVIAYIEEDNREFEEAIKSGITYENYHL